MDKMCNIVRSNITYLDSFTRSMVLCYYIALSQKMDGFDRTDNLTDLLYHVGPVVYEPYLTWLLVPYFYWYTGGMQTWLSPEKWRQPHGIYKDLARALKDTISLMIVFTAVIPAAIGAILLFGIEHGYRKFYKSRAEQIMKPINVEITMGHVYYKPTEHEVLDDYIKAISMY